MVGRVFESVGISEVEERVYLALLGHPQSSLAEIARKEELPRTQVQGSLRSLQEKGLVTESPSRPPRFVPAPPEVAVEMLIHRRQEELEAARLAALTLGERHRTELERTRAAELVEVVLGQRTIGDRYAQLRDSARSEFLVIDCPPYAVPVGKREIEPELELLRRGVRCRVIYAGDALESPGRVHVVSELRGHGEEARVLPDISAKLAIVDGRVGLIPLKFHEPTIEEAVFIRASFLLEALGLLFESLWQRATPLPEKPEPEAAQGRRPSPASTDHVAALLASGMQDDSIARALGVSRTTIERRVAQLMASLGARTRFQAGLLLGKRDVPKQGP
jgi:sugar-specific transcriptional regulator TrmB